MPLAESSFLVGLHRVVMASGRRIFFKSFLKHFDLKF